MLKKIYLNNYINHFYTFSLYFEICNASLDNSSSGKIDKAVKKLLIASSCLSNCYKAYPN